jgi:DisA bacterial checkpoint controller nucleotide-binding
MSAHIDCHLLQQLLIKYWDAVADLREEAGGLRPLLKNYDKGPQHRHSMTVASTTAMLDKCIVTLAHLAGMDGAVVLTYDCKVAAFNAIVSRSTSAQQANRFKNVRGKDINEADVIRNKGSRHQSALYFARTVPHSFAFVISQDESVSAFHNPGNDIVICEIGMRVLE